MAIDDPVELTTIGDQVGDKQYMFWAPEHFKAYQLRDYMDFRAELGTGDVTIMRLLANRDVHIYGELVLRDPAIRVFETLGITCTSRNQDIASFRTGGAEGDEVLRIMNTGDIRGCAPPDPPLPGGLTVTAQDRDGTYRDLTFEGADIVFKACGLLTTSTLRWGSIEFEGTPPERLLKVHGGTNYESLAISADSLTLKSQATSGNVFEIKDHASSTIFSVDESDDDVKLAMFGTVASQNTTPGALFVHYVHVTASSGTQNIDIDIEYKVKVIDVVVQKIDATGVGGDYVRIYRYTGTEQAISNTFILGSVTVDTVLRATSISDGYGEVTPPSQDLRIKAYQIAGRVHVICMRVS